jgi:hypothetical protein
MSWTTVPMKNFSFKLKIQFKKEKKKTIIENLYFLNILWPLGKKTKIFFKESKTPTLISHYKEL